MSHRATSDFEREYADELDRTSRRKIRDRICPIFLRRNLSYLNGSILPSFVRHLKTSVGGVYHHHIRIEAVRDRAITAAIYHRVDSIKSKTVKNTSWRSPKNKLNTDPPSPYNVWKLHTEETIQSDGTTLTEFRNWGDKTMLVLCVSHMNIDREPLWEFKTDARCKDKIKGLVVKRKASNPKKKSRSEPVQSDGYIGFIDITWKDGETAETFTMHSITSIDYMETAVQLTSKLLSGSSRRYQIPTNRPIIIRNDTRSDRQPNMTIEFHFALPNLVYSKFKSNNLMCPLCQRWFIKEPHLFLHMRLDHDLRLRSNHKITKKVYFITKDDTIRANQLIRDPKEVRRTMRPREPTAPVKSPNSKTFPHLYQHTFLPPLLNGDKELKLEPWQWEMQHQTITKRPGTAHEDNELDSLWFRFVHTSCVPVCNQLSTTCIRFTLAHHQLLGTEDYRIRYMRRLCYMASKGQIDADCVDDVTAYLHPGESQ
ncbi:hypothetical protein PROFUN_11478 [Planoprotostelium fungivorum]|uniref:C2H2-type domain-containing protein n=1 Tax=Planoprotostelium fungivorum TaxID=1890364 RepID=A0A2P6N9V4_9EUKA|nr:hypothetical protein PROFUN_11478 [Planoprotostelium fungivorum]